MKLRCREIGPTDIAGVVSVLKRGFPHRDPTHWNRVFGRLAQYRGVAGMPRFGYLLEADGQPVGALLLISSAAAAGTQTQIRGTLSAWCADPPYRSYASVIAAPALARRDVTYLNVTAAKHTWPILEVQGFERFAAKQFVALAGLCPAPRGTRVRSVQKDLAAGDDLSPAECQLLLDHREFGCTSVTCTADGRRHPFVFVRRWKYGFFPHAQLVYCRSVGEFARFAGTLGRFLALRGMPMVCLDADERLPGVPGRLSESWPKFFKGPQPPRLGDLSYTDRSVLGF